MDFIRTFFENKASLSDFFSLHGGAHRLAIPRVFFLFEYGLFSGSNIFLMLSSVLIQFSVVYLVWRLVRQENHMPAPYQTFIVAMTLLLMFNATQLENFIYTFDMQWFITTVAAVWAFSFWTKCFSLYADNKKISWPDLLLALLATSISMFSSFSGLCIWLVLPVLLFAYRLSGRVIAISTLLTVLIVVAYLQGPFHQVVAWPVDEKTITLWQSVNFLFSMLSIWLKWIALYFGSPLGREYFWFGTVFAYSSLLFLTWNWIQLIRKGVNTFTQFQIFCLSIALFAAAVGISTGLGRMYFVNTADVNRYQSIVLVYWLGIFGFSQSQTLLNGDKVKKIKPTYAVMAVIIFWTGLVIPIASIKDARAQINFFDRVNNANLAIATGQWEYSDIKDTLILGDKWKKENRPEKHAAFLRQQGWGIFAGREAALLGHTLDLTSISADACEGGINFIESVKEPYKGYRITGHGLDVMNASMLRDYVVINDLGRVMGLGRLQRQKDSLLPTTWQPSESARWLAYTIDVIEPTSLRVLGRRNDDSYCVMASATVSGHHP